MSLGLGPSTACSSFESPRVASRRNAERRRAHDTGRRPSGGPRPRGRKHGAGGSHPDGACRSRALHAQTVCWLPRRPGRRAPRALGQVCLRQHRSHPLSRFRPSLGPRRRPRDRNGDGAIVPAACRPAERGLWAESGRAATALHAAVGRRSGAGSGAPCSRRSGRFFPVDYGDGGESAKKATRRGVHSGPEGRIVVESP